jgi:hypothetical protein
LITHTEQCHQNPTKPKAAKFKLSDFTEVDEEPNHEGMNTPTNLDVIQQNSINEILTGLKYITFTLTKDSFEETKAEMLKIINHGIQVAKANEKTQIAKEIQAMMKTASAQLAASGTSPPATVTNMASSPKSTVNIPPTYAAMAAKQQQRETVQKERAKSEIVLALPTNNNPDALSNQIQREDPPEETLRQLMEEHINNSKTSPAMNLLGAKRVSKGVLCEE